jgi:hypothetical protein
MVITPGNHPTMLRGRMGGGTGDDDDNDVDATAA